jgi:hypothetical protein
MGREAIACDAEGALDAAAVTGTLTGRGRRLAYGTRMHDESTRKIRGHCSAGTGAGVPGGAPKAEPGAGSAGRGAA